MKTIEEHHRSVFDAQPKSRLTGIECPKCGEELIYSDDLVLFTLPPQKKVHCVCGYKTTIYV